MFHQGRLAVHGLAILLGRNEAGISNRGKLFLHHAVDLLSPPYPLWPAIQVESPIVKWELDLCVVMAETPVHLPRWTHVHHSPHSLWACVYWGRRIILAEACSWVADLVG